MNLTDLLQMTAPRQQQQQDSGLGHVMQFLAQHGQAPAAPQIQMPQLPDYGAQIMAHGLQKQGRTDEYAAHLKAKNDMEQQQAQAIVGHEEELTQDPRTLALLRSGNSQLVAQGIERANEEYQLKKKAEYNENATYKMYHDAVARGDTATAEEILAFKKAGGTNIYTGDGMQMRPASSEQKASYGIPDEVPATYNAKTGEVVAHPKETTVDQNQTSVYYKELKDAISQQRAMYGKISTTPGLNSDFFGSILKNNNLPLVGNIGALTAIGNQMLSPEQQAFEIATAKAKIMVIHALTAGGYTEREAADKADAYIPSWGDKDVELKLTAQEGLLESLGVRAGPALQQPADIAKVVDAKPGYNVIQTPEGDVVKQEGQRSWRNNNPGNIEYGDFAARNGAVGSDGRFAIFPSKEQGLNAQSDLLFDSDAYKNLPLTDAIAKYAPSFENNTPAYQREILNAVGGANKLMGQFTDLERKAILGAMHIVEGNKQGKSTVLKTSDRPLAKQALDVKKNSPVERSKNDARRAALDERAKRLGLI